jgi:hypothetical protein
VFFVKEDLNFYVLITNFELSPSTAQAVSRRTPTPEDPGSIPGQYMSFVVDKVAVEKVFIRIILFSPAIFISPVFRPYSIFIFMLHLAEDKWK